VDFWWVARCVNLLLDGEKVLPRLALRSGLRKRYDGWYVAIVATGDRGRAPRARTSGRAAGDAVGKTKQCPCRCTAAQPRQAASPGRYGARRRQARGDLSRGRLAVAGGRQYRTLVM